MIQRVQNVKHCPRHLPYYLVCFLTLFIGFAEIKAQNQKKIDSLQYLINRHGENFELLCEMVYGYADFDNRKAYEYARKCYKHAALSGDSLRIVKSGWLMGEILNRLENGDSALQILNYVLPIARRNKYDKHTTNITNSIGLTLNVRARYQEALQYLFESYERRKRAGNQEEISIVINNIGISFYKMKSYQKALPYFEECIKIKKAHQLNYHLSTAYVNAGICKIFLQRYDEAIEDIWVGIALARAEDSNEALISGYYSLGVTYFEMKQLRKAQTFFEKSYSLAIEKENKRFQADNLVYFAKLKRIHNLPQPAFQYLVNAAKICREHSYNELLITVYEDLISLQNQFPADSLAKYQQRYIALKDSTYHAELRDNLIMLETRLRKQENKIIIDNQAQILQLDQVLISKNKLMVWAISVVFLMAAVLLVLLYRVNIFKKEANANIEKSILLQTAALRESLKHLQGRQETKQAEQNNFLSDLNTHFSTIEGLSHIMNSTFHTIKISNATRTFRKMVSLKVERL